MDSPATVIERLKAERHSRTNDELLRELESLPVLPSEDSPAWNDDSQWQLADLFLALGDLAAERQLRPAVPLLLERACYGDPGEIMRGLRHVLEAIVAPDYDALTSYCTSAASSENAGARLWAVSELGVLRDRTTLPVLLQALRDVAPEIRRTACSSLSMLTQHHADLSDEIVAELTTWRNESADDQDTKAADSAIQVTQLAQGSVGAGACVIGNKPLDHVDQHATAGVGVGHGEYQVRIL